jgi:hypothetical protein
MGWWSKRQREGGRFGGMKKGTKLGPRRKIVEVLYIPDTIMSSAHVKFECGHEGRSWAGRSAPGKGSYGHCRKCLEEQEASQGGVS